MNKIPTIYIRNKYFKVTPKHHPDCDWVFRGEGLAMEKLDGVNVRLTIRNEKVMRVEKRRNPTKAQKKIDIIDPWYVEANYNDRTDKHIFTAVGRTNFESWPDGEHCCEAIGPKLQGNPLGLEHSRCVPFNLPEIYDPEAYSYLIPQVLSANPFDQMVYRMDKLNSLFAHDNCCPPTRAEGIVFHHPDGRQAKIKRSDF